eukprot:CAMPEP_0201903304 /NCGR_PEP_ID=MMETSP0902-20130614/55405_1 /ASSEMBLY_ACC=CAM_ASM_000551 /TAXON_ID=420261 /ORGANISM="Thalassiosira antarctica, Strain CCMP982" /LENGTH=107 /DNA_ID=CAMNT_0048437341 /DNA_START=784 /DNA_END=1110 /DNA_ORIENTATION=+
MDNEIVTIDLDRNMMVELSATASIITGRKNPQYTCSPIDGPVVVPIQVKGAPILVSLSTNSCVTVVPRSIVNTFGLKTKPIAPSQCIALSGDGFLRERRVGAVQYDV